LAARTASVVVALVLLLGVVVGTIGSGPAPAVAAESDPLGLVTRLDETRRYTLGSDVFEVWICPSHGSVGYTLNGLVTKVDSEMSGYFATLSGGRYDPVFVPAGTVPAGKDCRTWARQHPTGRARSSPAPVMCARPERAAPRRTRPIAVKPASGSPSPRGRRPLTPSDT
jgi:hypothetical protein